MTAPHDPKPLSPSRRLVLAHLGLGLAGLLFFAAALLHRAHAVRPPTFQPLLLGLVHALVLGWLLPTALGALHRLSPLLLGASVGSERASWCALALYVVGASGVTGHLWTFAVGWGLPCSAAILAASILLYAANFGVGLARGRERCGPSGIFVGAALAWLSVTALLGATLAWNLHAPFLRGNHLLWLKGHAHAGALGFFGLLVMGAALRLLEMFLVSRDAPLGRARVAWVATNAAVLALVCGFAGIWPAALVPAGGLLGASGVAFFVAQARAIRGRSLAGRLDHALRLTAASLAWLALAALAGATLALDLVPEEWRPALEAAYALLALVGFVGTIVIGQLYKILPSLLAPGAGLRLVNIRPARAAPPPLDADDLRHRLQRAALHGAVLAIALGIVADAAALRTGGAALFALGTALLARDVIGFAATAQPRQV